MPGDKSATWSLDLDSNAAEVSKKSAAELDHFRSSIDASTERLKEMSTSLRLLKGSSSEVADARAKLKARIDEERVAVSKNNLELLKAKTNYAALASAAKRRADEEKKNADASKGGAAAIETLNEKLEGLDRVSKTVGLAALAGGVAYLGAKAVDAAAAVGGFLLKAADLSRSLGLDREAALGSAENAQHMGEQIDALARKVPTSTEELSKLSVAIGKVMSGGTSRANGQTIVDTFNAVAEASSAMDASVGSALEDIITRNQRMGRVSLGRFELQGKWDTGYEDISKALAKNMNVGVDQAKTALAMGLVSLDAGAAAIRDAVEGRFGEINAKKLVSLDSLSTKLHDDWVNLTKGVNLEPILDGFKQVVDLFDTTHVEGYALKELFTEIGKDLGAGVEGGVPLVQLAVDEIILSLQELYIEFLESKKAIKDTFADRTNLEHTVQDVKDLAAAAADVAKLMLAVGKGVGWVATELGQGIGMLAYPILNRAADVDAKYAALQAQKGSQGIGKGMGDGIVKGLGEAGPQVEVASVGVVQRGLAAARGPSGADAHSPSRKTEALGRDMDAGLARGLGSGAAAARMASPPGPAALGGAAGSHTEVHIHINVDGTEQADRAAKTLSEPDFLGGLTKAVRQALVTAGVPTQAPAAP